MINYDISYYPVQGWPYTVNGNKCGDCVCDIWALYWPNPDHSNDFRRGKPLNNSIYLWYLQNGCAFGTNACISFAPGSTLNGELKTDDVPGDTPITISPFMMYTADSSSDADRGFRTDPSIRLAFDDVMIYPDGNDGGWSKSTLLYNIDPMKWCVYPQMAVYRYDTHVMGSLHDLTDIVAYMNADTTRRIVNIRNTIYRGNIPRSSGYDVYDDDGTPVAAGIMVGLLKERPINDNLQGTVGNYIKWANEGTTHLDWDSTKVYNPFNQYNTTWWFTGKYEQNARQHDIGFAIQSKASSLVSGRNAVTGVLMQNYGRCSAFWARYSPKNQIFDDVAYHWRWCVYDETIDRELPNGYDLSSISNHDLRIMAVLEIDDWKGAPTYGDAVKRAILHEVAFMGFWFAETPDKAQSDPLGTATTGAGVYLPEKIGGVTTGRYFTGDDIQDVPYAGATDVSPFTYTPSNTDDEGDFSTRINTGTISSGVKYYAMKESQMNALTTWLNTTYEPTDQDEFIQDFKGMNPADYITTVLYYPFDIPISPGADEPVTVGKLSTGNTGRALYYTYGDLYDYGYYDIPSTGNFIDYMRKIFVFVPFCGVKELDPIMWTGHRLTVKIAIDWPTGVCTAYLYRDTGVWDTVSGSIGVPLPLSAVANGSYQVAITNLLASHKSAHRSMMLSALGTATSAGATITGALSGNLPVAMGGIAGMLSGTAGIDAGADKMDNIDYNIDHHAPTISQVESGSPFLSCGEDYRVKIFIGTPILSPSYNAIAYGKTTGYSCCKQGALSTISTGYTECAGADLSGIDCTSTEKSMIFNALKGGVFV